MASALHPPRHNRRATDADPYAGTLPADGIRVSWGGIAGGVLLAVGVLILLTALGAAIGITVALPGRMDAGTAGRTAAIYGAAALLVALFFGGWAATRIGAITDRATGFCEGALVWVVAVLLMAGLAATGLSSLVGGAIHVAENATAGASRALEQAQPAAQWGAWITFGALLLSLLTAVIGAMAGRRDPLPRR